MATVIRADGAILSVRPKDNVKFTLEELQLYVGGMIELVKLNSETDMYVDEEGKIKNKTVMVNRVATYIAQLHGLDDVIVGDVVICGPWETGDRE